MLIFDDIFSWKGFGGVLQLAAGQCRLRIIDLQKSGRHKVTPIKPIVVVVSDLAENNAKIKTLSVRSCASHIATMVATKFNIDPHRMFYVEYYAPSTYGEKKQFTIPQKYEAVDFVWHEKKALHPKWRPLSGPMARTIAEIIDNLPTKSE